MSKKLEDLTLEEIKAQMSIYQTLYYKKKKQEDPEFAAKIREREREIDRDTTKNGMNLENHQ